MQYEVPVGLTGSSGGWPWGCGGGGKGVLLAPGAPRVGVPQASPPASPVESGWPSLPLPRFWLKAPPGGLETRGGRWGGTVLPPSPPNMEGGELLLGVTIQWPGRCWTPCLGAACGPQLPENRSLSVGISLHQPGSICSSAAGR